MQRCVDSPLSHHHKITVSLDHFLCQKFVISSFFFKSARYFQKVSRSFQSVAIQNFAIYFNFFILGIFSDGGEIIEFNLISASVICLFSFFMYYFRMLLRH